MHYKLHPERFIRHLITAPFIYSVLIPAIFLDVVVELYHRVSFPLYQLPYVDRKKFIRIDGQRLKYLKWYDKINCAYCGYINGLFLYVSKIAQESESYWCSIKHKNGGKFEPQEHQKEFMEYGDAESYQGLLDARKKKKLEKKMEKIAKDILKS